jgi:hypothetical protein
MLLLVALRLRRARRDLELAQARRASARAITLLLSGESAHSELAAARRHPWILVETALEFLTLVRGADHDRLCGALRNLKLDPRSLRVRSTRARRLMALEALAFFPGSATAATLKGVLADGQPSSQVAALRSLILLNAAPPLPELLKGDRTAWAQSRLFAEVAATVARDRPAEVREALGLDLAPAVRVVLLEVLGAAGDFAALPLLSAALAESDAAVRAAAVRALGALAHPSAAPLLKLAATDPAWQVRAEAMTAVGRSGLSAFAPILLQRLDDQAWWVRFRAGESLALLGQPAFAAPARGMGAA